MNSLIKIMEFRIYQSNMIAIYYVFYKKMEI